MSSEAIALALIKREDRLMRGDCTNDPSDKGGLTKWGITQKTWNGYYTKHPGLPASVCDIPLPQAVVFYKREYIEPRNVQALKDPVHAMALLDWMINSGSALSSLQKLMVLHGSLKEEQVSSKMTKLSNETVNAINSMPPDLASYLISVARVLHYWRLVKRDKTQEKYWRGWLHRVFEDENLGHATSNPALLSRLAIMTAKLFKGLGLEASRLSLPFSSKGVRDILQSHWSA